jgi:hypothetical protein
VRNNPLKYVDPSVHEDIWSDIGGFILGGLYGYAEGVNPMDVPKKGFLLRLRLPSSAQPSHAAQPHAGAGAG